MYEVVIKYLQKENRYTIEDLRKLKQILEQFQKAPDEIRLSKIKESKKK